MNKQMKGYKEQAAQDALFELYKELAMVEHAHTCMYYTPAGCTLHNKKCPNHACMDYWKEKDLPLFTKSQLKEASDFLWHYAMDHPTYMHDENQYEPDAYTLDAGWVLNQYANKEDVAVEDVQEAMELYTELQQTTYGGSDVLDEDLPF